MQVSIEHDDSLEAFGDQPVDHRSPAPAGTQNHGGPRHLLATDKAVERDAEAGHVRVVADQSLPLARDRVDRAGRVRLLGEAIDERDRLLLVGDRDVRPEELVAAKLRDGIGELLRRSVLQLVASVDPELVERSLLHRSRQ